MSPKSDKGTPSRRRIPPGLTAAVIVVPLTTMVSHAFGRTGFPLLLPAIKDDLALSNSKAGFASTVLFGSYLLGVVAVTLLAGRTDPLKTLRLGLLVSISGLGLLSVSSSFAWLLIGVALSSAGGAGIWITAPLLATQGVSPANRGVVIGLLTGSIGLANSAVALGTRAGRASSGDPNLWRPIYFWMTVAAIIILVLVVLFVPSQDTGPPSNQDRISGKSRDSEKPNGPGRSARLLDLAALKTMPGWIPITLGYVAFGIIASGFASFLAEALEEDGGLSRPSVSLVYVGLGFGSLLGAPLIGWLSDRTSRKAGLISVMAIMGTTSAVVALANGWLLIVVVLCFGGLWASYPTLTATYVRDHLDDRQFGQAYGAMTILYGTAAIIPPVVAGSIADGQGSFTIPYLLVASLAVIGMALLTRLPGAAPPHTRPQE